MYSLILLTLVLTFYIFVMYRMLTAYKLFKKSNFRSIHVFKKTSNITFFSLYFKYIFISVILFIYIVSIFFFRDTYFQFLLFWSIAYIGIHYNNVLLINASYISNLLYTVSIKDLDYIIIQEPSYTTSKLVFHIKDNKKLRSMTFSNKNISYIKESLREYGVEVHVSNK